MLVWFFFRRFPSPWRYAIYPALVLLSLLHLSALHVFLVFGVFEAFDFLIRRRCRIDRNVAFFALSLVASLVVQGLVENAGSGTGWYLRYVLNMAMPARTEAAKPAAEAKTPGATAQAPVAPPPPAAGAPEERLSYQEAWRIELLAFPWRNFPPSLATLATIASSFGVIFLLAMAGAIRAFRTGPAKTLDREMATFALAVPFAAYGLQVLLWALRDSIAVLPLNFEEIRVINMIMIPSVYFIFRLYELAPEAGRWSQPALRLAVMVAFALQPIVLVRALPAPWREALIDRAIDGGMLRSSDAPRMLYARQFLGLAGDGRRFYYSSRPAIEWLERHAGPDDKVLTNLNEFHMSRVKTVGPFLGVVHLQVWDVRRASWAESVEAIDLALASRDLGRVAALARSLGARYAVVDWPVDGAAYRDEYYSVIRVQ